MILIADSGSTKTNWCFISAETKKEYFKTSGINPYFRTTEDIVEELRTELAPKMNGDVEKIYFYGAGIVNDEIGVVVKNALTTLFPVAKCEIHSDLLGAARSTLQNKQGITCILGTGSNSCLYDGKKMVEHIPPLGFILGDEGSGAVLGKKILADFLKGLLPGELSEKFSVRFPYLYSEYLQKVYKGEKPNVFLASMVPFIKENLQYKYCKKLVEDSFREFFVRNVFQYKNYNRYTVCFVGSIAYSFSEILKKVIQEESVKPGSIVADPLEGLVKYHLEK